MIVVLFPLVTDVSVFPSNPSIACLIENSFLFSDFLGVGITATDSAYFDKTRFIFCSNSMCRNGQVWLLKYLKFLRSEIIKTFLSP